MTDNAPLAGVGYYVTARYGKAVAYLLGPYDTHAEALSNIERGTQLANDADPRAAFAAFGTVKLTSAIPARTAFGM